MSNMKSINNVDKQVCGLLKYVPPPRKSSLGTVTSAPLGLNFHSDMSPGNN